MQIRFSGIASGLDTESIIKDLMKVERVPIDKLKQEKQTVIWKRDAYRSYNTMLSSFRSAAENLRFTSSFDKTTIKSSNESIVSVTAGSGSITGSYNIKVDQLASSSINIGDSLTGAVDLLAKGLQEGSFTIKGTAEKTVNITADSTLDSIMKEINNANIGIKMSYDSVNKRFMIISTETGVNSKIEVTGATNLLESNFKIDITKTKQGENAQVTLNGMAMSLEKNSFMFNGATFQLKGVSTSEISVAAQKDTESIVNNIKEFVQQYNALVDKIQTETSQRPSSEYKALTDEQKEAMSEKQIELWETNAKKGLLFSDDLLQGALNEFKSLLSKKIEGLGTKGIDSLNDIGINFKSFKVGGNINELSKIEINESQLRKAVEQDSDQVTALFTKGSKLTSSDPGYYESLGIAERLYQSINTQMNKVVRRIGSSLISETIDDSFMGKKLKDINAKVKSLETRMQTVEDRYYRQFTAMEKAIQKMNSQSSWLSQQLG